MIESGTQTHIALSAPPRDDGACPPRRRPSALVVGAFPPQGGRAPLTAVAAAHALATLGHEVTTVSVTGAGDAHLVLDFRKGGEIARAMGVLRGRRWDTVVLDPEAFELRHPGNIRRIGVIPRQIAFVVALLAAGRRRVAFAGEPAGWRPLAAIVRTLVASVAAARPDAGLPLAEVRGAILDALGRHGGAPAVGRARRGPVRGRAALPPRALAAATAPDPHWSAPGHPVSRLAVHLHLLRRGRPEGVAGSVTAARALRAWFAAQGVATAPLSAPGRGEEGLARNLLRWWSRVVEGGGLAHPLAIAASRPEAAPLPDPVLLATRASVPPLVHLVGQADPRSGLGANLPMMRDALVRAGCRPVRATAGRWRAVALEGPEGGRLLRDIRIFHLNADAVPEALLCPGLDRAPGALEIGFLLWEFATLPEAHRLALEMLDEVWCPTRFVAEAYRAAGGPPARVIGKAVTLPPPAALSRAELGLPEDAFVFLQAFDFHSSVERKNPRALLHAFRAAFPGGRSPSGRPVALVFKTTEVVRGHWGDPHGQWAEIEEAARRDRRVRLLRGRVTPARYAALLAAADCVVSPHRAEGFGYVPAQAMLLGRPVVATDHSGTRDFCTPETAFPVPCRLREVRPGETIHPLPGGLWADIDTDALAVTLRRVVDDTAEATRRALAGRRLMASEYSVAAQAARLAARLEALGALEPATAAA